MKPALKTETSVRTQERFLRCLSAMFAVAIALIATANAQPAPAPAPSHLMVINGGRRMAVPPGTVPVIDSISLAGTNLSFVATFPAGIARAVLETKPTLAEDWQSTGSLEVPVEGGTIEFAIPLPTLPSAFFRLNATLLNANGLQTNAQYSAELQFFIVPPLGPDSENSSEAVFHFKGVIDGTDRIVIQRHGALWEHVNWGWPIGAITVNGHEWNPSEKNFMTTTGALLFLPEKYSLTKPVLERIAGRDVVALERTNDALIVYLDDTPRAAAPYEFKIRFPLANSEPESKPASAPASLKIAAVIDGSDLLKITAREARWTHRAWKAPNHIQLNDVSWDLGRTNVLSNTGTNRFLPDAVDFSSAKIVSRKGRDLVTMWTDRDALWINFADNPNGADAYELEISF